MKTVIAAALLSLSGACAFAAGPNLVANGSFEVVDGPTNYWLITEKLSGWQVNPDIEVQNDFEGNFAQDGKYFIELDTFNNSTMTQTIHATGWVELSFWYSARANRTGGATQTLGYSFGALSGTVLSDAVSGATTQWQHFTGLVDVGKSGSAELRFAALGPSDQFGGLLDNVSVTAVPEPASGWLALAGAAVLGGWHRRRRAAGR
ncbi:PEP-CTERM sorting domain-containing protein [Roseateles cellulosilyticus]|uniref:PEP-CTERM sorting domain-containing protein n=1 Tax=Pelomonas cellulosilytica TaxID=2906762 RepID=A0ABS8XSN0_9BURK|nr:PEP-CTERM sorting domain-containing protein [Pelomonas sp. P8]MCE4555729.1 PEP-CTERM sorting domain-containing protein [Pelomonas sp. P8]